MPETGRSAASLGAERGPARDAPSPRPDPSFADLPLFRGSSCRTAFLAPPPAAAELRARDEREHAEGTWGARA